MYVNRTSHHDPFDATDVSFPSTFYHSEVESFNRTREYVGADPHHWWHRLHHHQQPPDGKGKSWWPTWLRPHHRRDKMLDPGPHVAIGSAGAMRDELLDALFNFDSTWPEHLLHTLPLRELEHTYGYKLYRSKAIMPGNERPNNELIIEVGRFFKDLADEMSRPAEDGSLLDVKKKFSLASLYHCCYERGVLQNPERSPESQIRTSMGLIWNVLHVFNHVAILPRSLSAVTDIELNSFILDLLDQHYIRDGAPDHKFPAPSHLADDSHFLPKELCFKTLTELGGLKIEWTNQYTQHLRLIRSSKKLMLFWDVSIFGQSPLFVHWPLWLNSSSPSSTETASLRDYSVNSTSLLEELKRSYRIIFGNPDGRFLERFFRKHFGRTGDEIGILLRDVENLMLGGGITRVNISRSSARQALKYYFRAPIPRSIRNVRPELDRKRHRGPQRGPNIHFYLRKPTSGKLIDLLNAGPPYPLDFWMHISYLLEISQSVGLSEMERYSAYPIYGARLHELKAYMDNQRPKNLRQLYKDRRDTVGYWAFWAVVIVGGASIILALISIAVSSAQAVASFQALEPLHETGGGHGGRM
jgi:hypothetical protein